MKPHVIVYSRPGCHLCDDAMRVIEEVKRETDLTLEEVNIEHDLALLQRYRFDIPVITINGVEAFRHRVEPATLREALRKL
jgi:glutaredoxin